MSAQQTLAQAVQMLRNANSLPVQQAALPPHLQRLLKQPIPHLDASLSVAFIASSLWLGKQHTALANTVSERCFHADPQIRRIIAVVQAYGSGKTKTCLRLSDSFILLPIRFNVNSVNGTNLIDHVITAQTALRTALPVSPSYLQVQQFSLCCQRLVQLCLFSLISLYDHCIATAVIDDDASSRFYLALLMLTDHPAVTSWCSHYFNERKASVLDDAAFQQLSAAVLAPAVPRTARIAFLFDEVHVLFDKCRGYALHQHGSELANAQGCVADWRCEQQHGVPAAGSASCTDLFSQLRTVMLGYLSEPAAALGFVTCSTVLRTGALLYGDWSSAPHAGVEEFFKLHRFTHADIKQALLSLFALVESDLDALELAPDGSVIPAHMRLSAYSRPLFLMELLERLCVTFPSLPSADSVATNAWLRSALAVAQHAIMQRARQQFDRLASSTTAAEHHDIHLLYTAQRLCGGTLTLIRSVNYQQTLARIIGSGVACIDQSMSRIRITDPAYAAALAGRYPTLQMQHEAVIGALGTDPNLKQAWMPYDSATDRKDCTVNRLLAWLSLSGQLSVLVHDPPAPIGSAAASWSVKAEAETAGTIAELDLGTVSAQEPAVLQSIMRGTSSHILLPTAPAGPDLWMRASVNGEVCVLAVHCKVEDTVCTMARFRAALHTLDPTRMYASAGVTAALANWVPMLAELATLPYHRVVFHACGFSPDVQYYVREYNLRRGHSAADHHPRRFIHLLSLDDIRDQMGPSLYSSIEQQLHSPISHQAMAHGCMLACTWSAMTASAKNRLSMAELQKHCQHRGIPALDAAKRKPHLIDALNFTNQADNLSAFLNTLDPHFS